MDEQTETEHIEYCLRVWYPTSSQLSFWAGVSLNIHSFIHSYNFFTTVSSSILMVKQKQKQKTPISLEGYGLFILLDLNN